jgi:exodeoxyribonuclease-5
VQFSALQERAIAAFGRWYQSIRGTEGGRRWWYLGGYAGSGKSTLARHLAGSIEGRVEFAAYTGKAALVMRQKGCPGARTIHNLIYTPTGDPATSASGELAQLAKELEEKTAEWRRIYDKRDKSKGIDFSLMNHPLRKELDTIEKRAEELRGKAKRQPGFLLNENSDAAHAKLIVVDECSMVDARIGHDLLTFNTPVLVLGDPAQLPPVMGGGFFTEQEPDFLLDEIHRQAADSGIVRLATKIRNGGAPSLGDSCSDVEILSRRDETNVRRAVLAADQLLVGRNKTRHMSNKKIRTLLNRRGQVPTPGDRLVCLRNDHEQGLLNGSLWETVECRGEVHEDVLAITMKSLDEARSPVSVDCHTAHFLGEADIEPWKRRDAQEVAFGYALTVHKSQGSQWPSVCVIDESSQFPESHRHLYTAVTRAADKLAAVI